MIGYLAPVAHLAKAILVVAPFMTDEPRVPLDQLLSQGYEVKSATGNHDILLFLEKGAELYACQMDARMLASGFTPAGEFPAHDILCAPFR
jgi:hypothetical protein